MQETEPSHLFSKDIIEYQGKYYSLTTNKFAYDLNGSLVKATDGNGGQVTFAYNKLGYLTSETDARGNETTYTRNANGDILTETDALGNATEAWLLLG